MKSHAGKMKLVKSQGIISDPVVCDTIVDTSENEDFKFQDLGVLMNLSLKMCKFGFVITCP